MIVNESTHQAVVTGRPGWIVVEQLGVELNGGAKAGRKKLFLGPAGELGIGGGQCKRCGGQQKNGA
jgi:hypothetical protein